MPFPLGPYAYGNPAAMAGFDPDAAAYFAARPSLTNAQKIAFNQCWFAGNRTDGTRSLILFALPLVAGAFSDIFTMADGTAVTNHNFVSGDFAATGSSAGMTGNVAGLAYIDTLVANSALNQASFSLGAYFSAVTTTTAADLCFGRSGGNVLGLFEYFAIATYGFGGAQFATLTSTSTKGFMLVSRTSSTSLTLYQRGLSIATKATSDTGAPSNPSETGVVFAIRNTATTVLSLSDRTISFCVGTNAGLTIAQENLIEGRVNQLLNDLGASPNIIAGPYFCAYHPVSAEVLRMMQSVDGITFTYLPCTLIPTVGTVRDPSLRIAADFWRVAYTSCGFTGGTSFGVSKSPAHSGAFVTNANVDMTAIASVATVWGPKYFQDLNGTWRTITSCSTSLNVGPFIPYENHPTDADENTWSAPVQMTGAGFPANFIDGFVFQNPNDPTNLYMVGKNETSHALLILRTSDGTGLTGWAVWQSEVTHNSGTAESCSIDFITGTTFREYANLYTGAGMSYRDSTDGMATWGSWATITTPTAQQSGAFIRNTSP